MSLENDINRLMEDDIFKPASREEVKSREAEAEKRYEAELKKTWDSLSAAEQQAELTEYFTYPLGDAVNDAKYKHYMFADDAMWEKAIRDAAEEIIKHHRWSER